LTVGVDDYYTDEEINKNPGEELPEVPQNPNY